MDWKNEGFVLTDDISKIDLQVTHNLLTQTYWGVRRPCDVVEKMVRHSLCLSLLEDTRQIGFGRAVSDYTVFSWIADIVIDSRYRGKGLGKWMMACFMEHPLLQGTQMVLQTRDAHGLYEQYGFSRNPALMGTAARPIGGHLVSAAGASIPLTRLNIGPKVQLKAEVSVVRNLVLGSMLFLSSIASALDVKDFDAQGVTLQKVEYQGRSSIKVLESGTSSTGTDMLAILKGTVFHDGTIEIWMAGEPGPGAAEGARGFVGVAFRVGEKTTHYEALYIRPTNGRSDDQLRRNHSTQYISQPEYPWERLRNESPGAYESYADMAPSRWVRCRIKVAGAKAQLFLGDAEQPTLIVNDLKHGDESGRVALWIGPGTVAYFSGIDIRP